MANFNINNAPGNISMPDFNSISHRYGSLAKSCRFIARIMPVGRFARDLSGNGITNDLMYLCETTEMPGRGMMSVDLRYYGPSFKLPFQSTYEDISMTFLCRAESIERQFFDDWMTIINPTNTFDFNYRDDYKCNIEMFQYADTPLSSDSPKPKPTYAFTLLDAWPTIVNPQQVTWADDQFMRLGISFTYHWWVRKGRDPESSDGTPGRRNFDLIAGARNIY